MRQLTEISVAVPVGQLLCRSWFSIGLVVVVVDLGNRALKTSHQTCPGSSASLLNSFLTMPRASVLPIWQAGVAVEATVTILQSVHSCARYSHIRKRFGHTQPLRTYGNHSKQPRCTRYINHMPQQIVFPKTAQRVDAERRRREWSKRQKINKGVCTSSNLRMHAWQLTFSQLKATVKKATELLSEIALKCDLLCIWKSVITFTRVLIA